MTLVPDSSLSGSGAPATRRGCSLYRTAAQVIGAGGANILWTHELWDTDGYHDGAVNTDRVTIPAGLGGLYLCVAQCRSTAGVSGERNLSINKNGGGSLALGWAGTTIDTGNSRPLVCSAIIEMAAGDYIVAGYYTSNANDLDATNAYPRLTVQLISE